MHRRIINLIAVTIIAILFVVALHFPISTIIGLLTWQITMNVITDPLLHFEYEMTQRNVIITRASLPNHYQQVKQMFDDIEQDKETTVELIYDGIPLSEEALTNPTPNTWAKVSELINQATQETVEELFLQEMNKMRLEKGFC